MLRKSPLKKKSKKTKPQLVREADRLWASAVMIRANRRCEFCGKQGSDAHHMKSRRSHILRWSLCNGVFLCKGCHMRFHNQESWSLWAWMEQNRNNDWRYVVDHLHAIAPKDTLEKALTALKAWHEVNG